MEKDPIVIAGMARTPLGGFQGALKDMGAPALGAAAIKGALARACVPAEDVDEALMGCVLSAGLGQAARPPGGAWRGPASERALHHHQQGLRLRHEGAYGRPMT